MRVAVNQVTSEEKLRQRVSGAVWGRRRKAQSEEPERPSFGQDG